jgi:secretion/DNA translocation related TadE-like protein
MRARRWPVTAVARTRTRRDVSRDGRARPIRDDSGSGAVLAVAILGLAVTAALTTGVLGSALVARQQIVAASDAAALAAADAASGAVTGEPCGRATQLAAADGARLTACTVDGATVDVAVAGSVLGVTVTARSRAGPPPDAVQPSAEG